MNDTTIIATEIRDLIATGASEWKIVAQVSQKFPEITPTEFVEALQDATEQAQRQALRPHH